MESNAIKPAPPETVEETTRMREAAAARPYTITDAIADARWLRRTPDGLMAPERQHELVGALLSALERSPAYLKAMERGQEVFVLVQQDRAAPDAIVAWADTAETHGCNSEKIDEAYRLAGKWRGQESGTKWPD